MKPQTIRILNELENVKQMLIKAHLNNKVKHT